MISRMWCTNKYVRWLLMKIKYLRLYTQAHTHTWRDDIGRQKGKEMKKNISLKIIQYDWGKKQSKNGWKCFFDKYHVQDIAFQVFPFSLLFYFIYKCLRYKHFSYIYSISFIVIISSCFPRDSCLFMVVNVSYRKKC